MDSSKTDFVNAFRQRTKAAAVRVIKLYQNLPPTGEAQVLRKQLLRSATSVAANYRAVCRARSAKEQYAKLCICVEEADESQLWLEILREAGIVPEAKLVGLEQECLEIVSVLEKPAVRTGATSKWPNARMKNHSPIQPFTHSPIVKRSPVSAGCS